VRIRWAVAATALLAVAGCSSVRRLQTAAGTLVAGTAQVTVNGQTPAPPRRAVRPAGSLTTITTGDQSSGISALISNKDQLTTEAVGINNVSGFTGSYNAGLAGPRR